MAQAPLDPNQETVNLSIRLVEETVSSFTELAASQNTHRSTLIREVLEAYLEQHQEVLAS